MVFPIHRTAALQVPTHFFAPSFTFKNKPKVFGESVTSHVVRLAPPTIAACARGLLTAYVVSQHGRARLEIALRPVVEAVDRQLAALADGLSAFVASPPLVVQSEYFDSDLARPGEDDEDTSDPVLTEDGAGGSADDRPEDHHHHHQSDEL